MEQNEKPPVEYQPGDRLANAYHAGDAKTGGFGGAAMDTLVRGPVGGLAAIGQDIARPLDWAAEQVGVDLWDDRWYGGDILEGSIRDRSDATVLGMDPEVLVKEAVRFIGEEYLTRGLVNPATKAIARRTGLAASAVAQGRVGAPVASNIWRLLAGGTDVKRAAEALKLAETVTAYGGIAALQSGEDTEGENIVTYSLGKAGEFIAFDTAFGIIGPGLKWVGGKAWGSATKFVRRSTLGKTLDEAMAKASTSQVTDGLDAILELTDDELLAAKAAGRLSPDLVDRLVQNKYDTADVAYKADGPERSRVLREITDAGADADTADAALAMHDAFASLMVRTKAAIKTDAGEWAINSLDDYYATLKVAGGAAPDGVTARGVAEFGTDGQTLIRLFTTADRSTLFHESSHIFRRHLPAMSQDLSGTANKWVGAADNTWTREQEEKWAGAFERYLIDGSAPTKKLGSVFEMTKAWLLETYRNVVNSPASLELSPDIKGVFDQMLGGLSRPASKEASINAFNAAVKSGLEAGVSPVAVLQQSAKVAMNWDHIKTTQDVLDVLKGQADSVLAVVNAAKGDVQSHAELVKLADGIGARDLLPLLLSADKSMQNVGALMFGGKRMVVGLVEDAYPLMQRLKVLTAAGKTSGNEATTLQVQIDDAMKAAVRVWTLVSRVNREGGRLISAGNINATGKTGIPLSEVAHVLSLWDAGSAAGAAIGKEAEQAAGGAIAAMDAALKEMDGAAKGSVAPGASGGRVLSAAHARRLDKVIEAIEAGQAVKVIDLYTAASNGKLAAVMELWTASLLSGMRTQAANFSGNAINTLIQPLSKAAGELLRTGPGSSIAANVANAAESLTLYHHLAGAMLDMWKAVKVKGGNFRGFRAVADALRHETGVFEKNVEGLRAPKFKAEAFNVKPGTAAGKAINAVGVVARAPGMRLLGAADELFLNLNYLAYIRMEAAKAAKAQVRAGRLSPTDIGAFMAHEVDTAFKEGGAAAGITGGALYRDAYNYAKDVAFKTPLNWGTGDILNKARERHPWLGIIVPFITTPVNIYRSAARMSPMGPIQYLLEKRYGKLTAEQMTRRRGDVLLGAAFWSGGFYLATSGMLTGGGPNNPHERSLWLADGNQPYSIVVTGDDGKKSYIAINRFEPVGSALSLVADAVELHGHMEAGEWEGFLGMMLASYFENLTNKTYVTGISDFFDAMTDPQNKALPWVRRMAASMAVPTAVSQFATSTDEHQREARSMLDAIRRRVPGMSQDLAPRRNILGEPITPPGGYIPFVDSADPMHKSAIARMLSPAALSRRASSKVLNELAELRHGIMQPPKRIDGLDLTMVTTESGQEAYDRWLELTGTVAPGGVTLHEALDRLISTAGYQAMPPAPTDSASAGDYGLNPRLGHIMRVLGRYRELARRQLIDETPELREHLDGVRERRAATRETAAEALLEKLKR